MKKVLIITISIFIMAMVFIAILPDGQLKNIFGYISVIDLVALVIYFLFYPFIKAFKYNKSKKDTLKNIELKRQELGVEDNNYEKPSLNYFNDDKFENNGSKDSIGKIGVRTPSISKSISARTTGKAKRKIKSALDPTYNKKGMGYVKNPKRAIKNKIYKKKTKSLF